MTLSRRSSAFIANARVSSTVDAEQVSRRRRPRIQGGVRTPSAAGAASTSVRWIAVA